MNSHTMRIARWIVGPMVFCAISAAAPQANSAEPQNPAITTTEAGRGYVHDISRSRFKIGQNTAVEVDTPMLRRWRGSLGAWAIDPTNNWTMGLLDATTDTGPYVLDEALHGELVKRYFIAAGLPADQIQGIRATYEVAGGGRVQDGSTPIQLLSITSILTRAIKGIPVVESVAWAKMTIAGDVDMESVFWPPVDPNVVERATALAQQMAEPTAHAAFLASLPGHVYKDGGVVIHHTDPSVHATPTAYVSYDVTLAPGGHAAMRHFDENGVEFQLPQERLATPLPAAARPPKPQPR
jgi:hypothetical protein